MTNWWVNHKQTYRQEVNGGYVWSPKRMQNGNRSQYYDFMREMRPGDHVVSFAHAKVSNFGVVVNTPISAPKPLEFGSAGDSWANDGWLVPIAWKPVDSPFRPKDHIERLRLLLPNTYSPIQETGNGNQAAYLTKISEELFLALESLGGFVRTEIADEIEPDDQALIDAIEDQVQSKLLGQLIEDTEADAIVTTRRGQGLFRKNVETYERQCRVTGLRDRRLLVASHIKPWRVCETAAERLDGANGLLLAPHIDRLFDRGLITFSSEGTIVLSSTLTEHTIRCLSLVHEAPPSVGKFGAAQESYLAYHRAQVFIG